MSTRTNPRGEARRSPTTGLSRRLARFFSSQRLVLVGVAMVLAIVVGATQLAGVGRLGGSGGVTITPVSSGLRARLNAGGDGAAVVEDKTLHTLEALRQKYGDPPNANGGRIKIPSINVDAPISTQIVAADGQLPDPIGPSDVAWYDFSKMPNFGGTPGAGGNAIFAAHVDRAGHLDYANVDYSGPGIFFWLDRLSAGDVIEVTMRGKTLRYAVTWTRQVAASDRKGWNDVMSSKVDAESITLVTCGGDFDRTTQEYASRTVVRATRS